VDYSKANKNEPMRLMDGSTDWTGIPSGERYVRLPHTGEKCDRGASALWPLIWALLTIIAVFTILTAVA
jgi:hypothetical protein